MNISSAEWRYKMSVMNWNESKKAFNSEIKNLRNYKYQLSYCDYLKIKLLTKGYRIGLEDKITISFNLKIEAHDNLENVRKYLASQQKQKDDLNTKILLEKLKDTLTKEELETLLKLT